MNYYDQKTSRLLLSKMRLEDLPEWTKFFQNNPLEKYIGIDISLPMKVKAKNWIDLQLTRYRSGDFGHLAARKKDTNQLVGVGGFIKREIDSKQELEIAYSIIPHYWNMGYATEIANQIRKYGVENRLADSFISIINVENDLSKKVALKNGMRKSQTTTFKDQVVDIYRTIDEL